MTDRGAGGEARAGGECASGLVYSGAVETVGRSRRNRPGREPSEIQGDGGS